MNIEEAKLYLEHTSKDDFNLEEHQKENRYQAIQAVLEEIERLNNIIKHTDSWIDRTIVEKTIKIIKQQPSEDDTWILERLYGIKQCLQGVDKE